MPYKLIDSKRGVTVGMQTDVSADGEGKWIGIDQVKEDIDPFVFSDDDMSSEDDDDMLKQKSSQLTCLETLLKVFYLRIWHQSSIFV